MVLFTSCATPLPRLSCDEICAKQGMVCSGAVVGSSSGLIDSGGPGLSFYSGSSSGITCARDAAADPYVIMSHRERAENKEREAEQVRKSNSALGVIWGFILGGALIFFVSR